MAVGGPGMTVTDHFLRGEPDFKVLAGRSPKLLPQIICSFLNIPFVRQLLPAFRHGGSHGGSGLWVAHYSPERANLSAGVAKRCAFLDTKMRAVKPCAHLGNRRGATVIWQAHNVRMQDELVRALRARRAEIHARWEALLRIEKVNTPLANPDALVFMIDWTLDECFASLRPLHARRRNGHEVFAKPDCPCGRNPLLTYFAAGEQAIEEALILEQASASSIDPVERDDAFAELKRTVREIARREIEAFCSVCQFRDTARSEAATAVATATPTPATAVPVSAPAS